MANDCVKTRLKATVDNPNLVQLGHVRVTLYVPNNYINAENHLLDDINGVDIKLLDDGVTFTTGSGGATVVDSKNGKLSNNRASTLNLNGVPSNKLIRVEAGSKYDIVFFKLGGGNLLLDDYKYTNERLAVIDFSHVGINGDAVGEIKVFNGKTNLQMLQLQYNNNVSGDIQDIGACTAIAYLSVAETSVTGNWVNFVNSQIENGRTSCTGIEITMAQWTNISFGNLQEYPRFSNSEPHAILKWSNSKISIQDKSGNLKKIYLYGYSSSEAQEYRNQGYTVIIAD